ncbi:hypothetical protein ACOMHN_047618 [Nucella lapillus]
MNRLLLIAACMLIWVEVNSQSVVQQCLTDQIRNRNNDNNDNNDDNNINNNNNNNNNNNVNNNNNFNQQQSQSAEEATFNAFQSICQNYPGYIECFQNRLWGSTDASDRFLALLFRPQCMTIAYRGLCQNLEVIQENIRCLLSTPEVRHCYDNFNNGVQQVVTQQNQGQQPRATLQQLACNISVARYQCETAVYKSCDAEAGRVMLDFFYAGVPQECRNTTGVTSLFVQLWGGAAGITGSRVLYVFSAGLVLLWTAVFL